MSRDLTIDTTAPATEDALNSPNSGIVEHVDRLERSFKKLTRQMRMVASRNHVNAKYKLNASLKAHKDLLDHTAWLVGLEYTRQHGKLPLD